VISETAPDGGRTTYVYDTRDNLVELIDANRHTTVFTYDRSNRQLSETRPGGQRLSYTYDGAGNLKTQTDGNGRHTIHSYDDRTRLTRTDIYEFTGAGAPFKSIDYFYNEADSLTGYDDGATSAVYSYDDLQRRTSETIDYGPFSLSHSYGYYANHQKQSYTDPAGRTRTLSYDEGGRPTGLDLGEAVGEVAITAYEWQRPTRIVLPGGGSITVGYNGLQQPVSIDARDPGGAPVMQRTYQYRRTGAIQSQTTAEGQIGYNYDPVERLRGATSPARDERFVYDFLGNRSPDDGAPAWGYNENNQLTGTGTITYDYDDHGNMAVKRRGTSEINFSYTPDNRLAFLTDEAGATIGAYGYDPFGRRLFKEVNGTRTYFLYNDEGLVGEYSATGAELRTYGYHPGAPWSTNPLFVQENGIYYYYLNDHLGTPQKIMSDNGTVVWAATYESFGTATITTATITNNLRFPGQYFDSESGLQYNWHRFYDPSTGRYISADPIGLDGGINLYGYVNQDPVNLVDSFGLRMSGRNNPYEYGRNKGKRRNIDGLTTSFEAHFVLGGGQHKIRCCDRQSDEILIHKYRKICYGAAVDISGGIGQGSGFSGDSCRNPPMKLLGGELGFLFFEGGISVGADGSGIGGTGAGNLGLGIGGVKATACFYFYMNTEYTGEKCCD
jgi:RHS repeat-associated protein